MASQRSLFSAEQCPVLKFTYHGAVALWAADASPPPVASANGVCSGHPSSLAINRVKRLGSYRATRPMLDAAPPLLTMRVIAKDAPIISIHQ
jgi:hypothetical protein